MLLVLVVDHNALLMMGVAGKTKLTLTLDAVLVAAKEIRTRLVAGTELVLVLLPLRGYGGGCCGGFGGEGFELLKMVLLGGVALRSRIPSD